jgi:ClpP class serine protease
MKYAFLNSLLTSPWQVDYNTFAQHYPILRGVFNGIVYGDGQEPQNSIPYMIATGANETEQKKYVNVIPIRGIMLKHDTECGPVGMRTIGQRLINSDKNPNITGNVLLFESGGGQSVAVPEITDAIKACKKPVVAFIDGFAFSAAYYAASYCKEIIASRAADEVGSIGTLIAFEEFEKFVKSPDGITHVRIYADGSDDKNGEFETALTGNFKLIKEKILNPVNEQFKADVKANRPKVTNEHLTGKTFKASEILGILVDAIGSLQDAVNRVAALADADKKNKNASNNTLNMDKYPLLFSALGVNELAITDGSSSLSEQQLTAIENALATERNARTQAQTELAAASANLAAANTNLETANAAKTIIENNLQNANNRITVLEKELEKKPGAKPLEEEQNANPDATPTADETFFGRFSRLQKELNS